MRRVPTYRFGAVGPAVGLALALSGCAALGVGPRAMTSSPEAVQRDVTVGDPFEGANRRLYHWGRAFDRTFIWPLLAGYQRLGPAPLRRAVHNVLQTAGEPLVVINDLLQARPAPAARAAVRFVGNATIGIGGVFDPMTRAGAPHHDNDFGVTLGRYGIGPGPYLFLPVVGPTSPRDAFGAGVDYLLDPLSWLRFRDAKTIGLTTTALGLADDRLEAEADLRTLEASAVDPYATVRSAYRQARAAEVTGTDGELEALPELPVAPAAPPASETPGQDDKVGSVE